MASVTRTGANDRARCPKEATELAEVRKLCGKANSVQKFHQGISGNSLFPKFHEISVRKIVFHEISVREMAERIELNLFSSIIFGTAYILRKN